MYERHSRGALDVARVFAAAAAVSMSFVSAQAADITYYGPSVPLAEGSAQAWVSIGQDGQPTALGITLSASAVATVGDHDNAALTLPFPAEAVPTGFNHVLLNWNSHGHPPVEIWGTPHFDVHFAMVSPDEMAGISTADPEFVAKTRREPAARYLPAGYVTEGEAVPGMGVHWADATTPEFHGAAFTHTLIYGAWDGRVIFVEPMIDKSVLERKETVVAPVKQPSAYALPGYYPTQYRIDFDPQTGHRVVMEGLVAHR